MRAQIFLWNGPSREGGRGSSFKQDPRASRHRSGGLTIRAAQYSRAVGAVSFSSKRHRMNGSCSRRAKGRGCTGPERAGPARVIARTPACALENGSYSGARQPRSPSDRQSRSCPVHPRRSRQHRARQIPASSPRWPKCRKSCPSHIELTLHDGPLRPWKSRNGGKSPAAAPESGDDAFVTADYEGSAQLFAKHGDLILHITTPKGPHSVDIAKAIARKALPRL